MPAPATFLADDAPASFQPDAPSSFVADRAPIRMSEADQAPFLATVRGNDSRTAALGQPFAQVQPDGSVIQAPPENDPQANQNAYLSGPGQITSTAFNAVEKGAAAALNIPAAFYRIATDETPQQTVTTYDATGQPQISQADAPLPFQAGQPVIQFPRSEMQPNGNDLERLLEGFSTPGNLALFPFAGTKAVQAAFLTQTVPGAIEATKKLLDPNLSHAEKQSAATDALINTLMSGALGGHLAGHAEIPEWQGPKATGEMLQTPEGAKPSSFVPDEAPAPATFEPAAANEATPETGQSAPTLPPDYFTPAGFRRGIEAGQFDFGDGVHAKTSTDQSGEIVIDRLFVPENLRRQGRAKSAIASLAQIADANGVKLNTQVFPDDFSKTLPDSSDGLRRALMANGFKPYDDGEGNVYRNDLSREPVRASTESTQLSSAEPQTPTENVPAASSSSDAPPEQSAPPEGINVPPEQWSDMATLNQAGQLKKYGTTRARLMEQAAIEKFKTDAARPVLNADNVETTADVDKARQAANTENFKPAAAREQKKFLLDATDDAIEAAPEVSAAAVKKQWEATEHFSAHAAADKWLEQNPKPASEMAGNPAQEAWQAKGNADLAPLLAKYAPEPRHGDAAIKVKAGAMDAFYRSQPHVSIEVPGDGTFSILNTKSALREFKERAAKFPTSAPRAKTATTARATPASPAALGKLDKTNALKTAKDFAAEDASRVAIHQRVWSDGKHTVATDGRRLIAIDVGVGGTEKKPGVFNVAGEPIKDSPNFPAWRNVIPDASRMFVAGKQWDAAKLFTVLKQADEVGKESFNHTVKVWRNKDGSFGISADHPALGEYNHNISSDARLMGAWSGKYLMDAVNAARRLGDEKVDFLYTDEMSPLVVQAKGMKAVIMPIRVERKLPAGTQTLKRTDLSPSTDKAAGKQTPPPRKSNVKDSAPASENRKLASPPQLERGGELGNDAMPPAEPKMPENDNTFSNFNAMPMEMPEAVRVIKELTGKYPRVREFLGRAAGLFRFTEGPNAKGSVDMLASQFDLLTPQEKSDLRKQAWDYAKATTSNERAQKDIAENRYQYLLKEAYEEAKVRNPIQAMKTIWHEIGHVVDWITHKNFEGRPETNRIYGRGNLFGHIANLKGYTDRTLPFDPTRPAGKPVTPADLTRLRGEAEAALRKEMGPIIEIVRKIIVEEPEWKITGVTVQDVKDIMGEFAGRDTPELTRWFSEQDRSVKADILKKAMRGLLDERLARFGKKEQTGTRRTEKTLREKQGREPTPDEIKKRFAELLAQEIRNRNLADLKTVKAELNGLIAWWRGTDKMPDYFKSAEEMYADAFSVWTNNPAAALKRAPVYSELMWNYLDRKPQVKALYDQIQTQIKTGVIMPKRVSDLHAMWDGDDERSLQTGKEANKRSWRDFYDDTIYRFDRRFGPIYKAAQGYARKGEMKEAIANHLYRATEHERFLGKLNHDVGKLLVKNSLDWSHDLGEYLYHKRVIEERSNIANPLGFTPKNSLERLAEMQKDLGPQRWHALEAAATKWHELYQEHVVKPLVAAHMFTPELNQILTDRAHYATFAAIKDRADTGIEKIVDAAYGQDVGPHIYRQIGNLGEIKNPATATILKGLSLISAEYRNTMKREVVRMLKAQSPDDIMEAKTRWNGKATVPVIVEHPKVGTIVYLQDGKAQAFYVRRVVADGVNQGSPTQSMLFNSFRAVNGFMKAGFTQLNYAFWPVNFVRDTAGVMYQMPGAVLPAYLKNLPRAIEAARQSVIHAKPNADADAALRRKLIISKGDPRGVSAGAENEFELKVASFGMDPAQWHAQDGKVGMLVKAWNKYREFGETVERINKISGMLYLDQKFPNMPEWQKNEIIRERSGSPNFLERGASNPAVDMLFLFYNPWKEGVRSLVKSARENPFSFTAKAAATIAVPTVLQAAAVNGYLGAQRKKEYASIPDYDLTNYLCVPLNYDDKTGKVTYFRFPLWEPARIAHGSLFQMLTKRGAGIASNAGGQLPGLNPIWQVGLAGAQYAMGQNPYDLSRGVDIMPKTTFQAGGLPAAEALGKYAWNSLGGSIVNRFQNLNLEAPPQTGFEKFLNLPVINNALGRWVKVSDRGLADTDRATIAPIEQQQAQLRLAAQGIMGKMLVNVTAPQAQWQAFTDSEKVVMREPYLQNYIHEEFPALLKSQQSEIYRRLHNAPDKAAKAAIATQMQKQ